MVPWQVPPVDYLWCCWYMCASHICQTANPNGTKWSCVYVVHHSDGFSNPFRSISEDKWLGWDVFVWVNLFNYSVSPTIISGGGGDLFARLLSKHWISFWFNFTKMFVCICAPAGVRVSFVSISSQIRQQELRLLSSIPVRLCGTAQLQTAV